MKWLLAIAIVVAAGGCGEDEPPPTPPQQATRAPAAPAGANQPAPGAGSGKLTPQQHAEDRVACKEAPPDQRGATCDPQTPACEKNQWCITTASGSFCSSCPEREAIRHVFKERDFVVADENRDPFQSFVIGPQPRPGDGSAGPDPTERCKRKDQLVAVNYSYQDLKLVGIIAQATRRRVLMMDTGNTGHIIKLGDCVGKEKAVVKDIGAGYVTFTFDADGPGAGKPTDHSVQLHPTLVSVSSLPSDVAPPPAEATTVTPIVTPPPMAPSAPAAGAGAAKGNTVIIPQRPPQQVPPQAPTTLRP